jgi:hypothetical protein
MKGFNSRYSQLTPTGYDDANSAKDWVSPAYNSLYNFYKFFDKDDLDFYIRTNHSKYINNQQFRIPFKFKKRP